MSLEEMVIEYLRGLPVDKQHEVLDFVRFLRHRAVAPRPPQSLKGLWSGVRITEEDIAEGRREMWENFPREDA